MVQGTGSGPGNTGVGRETHPGADGPSQSAGHLKDQAQHQAGKVADQAQHQMGKAADQVQHQVGQIAEQAREQGMSWASSQKDRVGDGMGSLARALRQSRQQLEQDNQQMLAGALGTVADQVEHFSHLVRERDVDQLMGEVERTARRQPTLFLSSAFVLGLVAARFLKSSAPEMESDYGPGAGYGSSYRGGYGPSESYGGGYGAGYGSTQPRTSEFRPKPPDRPATDTSGAQTPYRDAGSGNVR